MPTQTVRKAGSGTASLLNLSPQWYNAYRAAGFDAAKRREVFMKLLGMTRKVEIENAGAAEFGYEITTFRKPGGGNILFLVGNPETSGTEAGGGNAVGLKTTALNVTLKFAAPVHTVRDERTGKSLGDGQKFPLVWKQNEAVVLSFT